MRGPLLGWPWVVAATPSSSSSSRSGSPERARRLGRRARGMPRAAHTGGGGVIPRPRSDSREQRRLSQHPSAGLIPARRGGVKCLTPPRPSPAPCSLSRLPAAQGGRSARTQGEPSPSLPGQFHRTTQADRDEADWWSSVIRGSPGALSGPQIHFPPAHERLGLGSPGGLLGGYRQFYHQATSLMASSVVWTLKAVVLRAQAGLRGRHYEPISRSKMPSPKGEVGQRVDELWGALGAP